MAFVRKSVCASFVLLAACGDGDGDPTQAGWGWDAPASAKEIERAASEALLLAVGTDMRAPWAALAGSLDLAEGGCPDTFDGEPPGFDVAGAGSIGSGEAWSDACESGGATFAGSMYWEHAADASARRGARLLVGDGVVGTADQVLFEFDGDGTDRYEETTRSDGSRVWTYHSEVVGNVTGSLAFGGTSTPGGFRTDLDLWYSGGDDEWFEAIGNLFLYEDTFAGDFDSLWLDMELQGEAGASADDCTLEPRGVISVRDTEAHWYDLVFAPRYDSALDYENEPYSACDGCGTLYYRGSEQPTAICPDWDALRDELAAPPSLESFDL
jgi:hypothetical protein